MASKKSSQNPADLSAVHLGGLINTSYKGPNALASSNYCAVSFTWGYEPPQHEVAGIPWKVPITDEGKLLFILEACARRGYEYVWMDVLCVDQGSTTEKSVEIPKMKDYYKNAHATIVFGDHYTQFPVLWNRVEVLISEWGGEWDKEIDPEWEGFGDIDCLISDAWFHRVWTLQEAAIPLTTRPLDTHPASYTSARLLTSDGAVLDIRGLCNLIEWTFLALGKLDRGQSQRYDWIRPGEGIVNIRVRETGEKKEIRLWECVAKMIHAIRPGPPLLHPIQAIMLTNFRDASREIDKLRGFYALIDSDWHSMEKDLNGACTEIAKKYVLQREGALLLAMGATTKPTRTWAAAAFRKEKESEFGSFVPDSGRYPLISGSSEITDLGATYGDGSGELYNLIERLDSLSSNHDISSIITLLRSVILRSRIDLKTIPLNDIQDIHKAVSGTRYGNAISSVLRSTFSGWYRRIVIAEKVAFLAWIPYFTSGVTYSLLWLTSEIDEWAVVVEGPLTECKKAGVAFVGGLKPVGSKAVVTIL